MARPTTRALRRAAHATDRLFTYVYEPETMPKGAMEFEQWATWRGGRTEAVGQDKYSRWDLRILRCPALMSRRFLAWERSRFG